MVTLEQVRVPGGFNVVATGSGPINLTGLTFVESLFTFGPTGVNPAVGNIATGPAGFMNLDLYRGFTGPKSFGPGFGGFANSSSGDYVFIVNNFVGDLFLPAGYVSNTALSNSMTFDNTTLALLGATPGTYKWTWGTGLPNQNFTLVIPAVPDGGSTVSLLGFALLGLAALRRKLGC